MAEEAEPILITGGYRFGMAPNDPSRMILTLAASRDGPRHHFLFDAPMLDQLAKACSEAATKIRSQAS